MSLLLLQNGKVVGSAQLPDPIPSSNLQHWQETYINHLGATDNFTETVVSGTGSATADTTNHEMDLAVTNVTGASKFQTKKTWTLSTAPLVGTLMLNNINLAASADMDCVFGLAVNLSGDPDGSHACGFYRRTGTTWYVVYNDGDASATYVDTGITPSSSQILTIVATSSKIDFYIDGVKVHTATTNLPVSAMNFGVGLRYASGTVATKSVSVDFMGITRFVI